jgi:uncharacterized protein (TIGR02301 family)
MTLRAASAILLAGAFALAPAAALAQDRSPADRQTLVALAYVLGESHALRQACVSSSDQYWRERMRRLEATEQPDGPFDRRLEDSFNDGFLAGRANFPECNQKARDLAASIAAKGQSLVDSLSTGMAEDGPAN